MNAMKLHKRCYAFLFIFFVVSFCLLVIRISDGDRKKSVTRIDPNTKQHWFRIRIIENPRVVRKAKVILLWTSFFGSKNYVPPLSKLRCSVSDCVITSNRTYLAISAAVIFHLRDITLSDLPRTKPSWQIWILLHHEAPPHTPKLLHHLNGYINWTATYRMDSEILLTPTFKKKQNVATNFQMANLKNKTKMVAWFASNCKTHSNREGFVKELQKSIPVDIYGECGTKQCLPKMSTECYKSIAAEYRYYLSFENSICKDYVTEKFFYILDTNMIPVVLGGADYSKFAPPNSYIDALSFKLPRALASHLISVAKDEKKYNSYFEWKNTYEWTLEHYACQICKKLHDPIKITWYKDINRWWFKSAHCRSWNMNYPI